MTISKVGECNETLTLTLLTIQIIVTISHVVELQSTL
jgi:hypothetical protein